jgi:hypothetical protein
MKLEFDFSELIEFGEKLNDYHTFETYIMTATKEVARVLHNALLNKTPIDTGNLRKMWSAGDNLAFIVEKEGNGYMVTFTNDAQNATGYKYGRAVNYGHKTPNGGWVQGRFFVENSVIETEEVAEKLIQKELRKWLEWCVNGK